MRNQLKNIIGYHTFPCEQIKQRGEIPILYLDNYLYNNEYYIAIMKTYISSNVVIIHYEICKGCIKYIVCNSLEDFEYICKSVFDNLYGRC